MLGVSILKPLPDMPKKSVTALEGMRNSKCRPFHHLMMEFRTFLKFSLMPSHMPLAALLILPGNVLKKSMVAFHLSLKKSTTFLMPSLILSQCFIRRPGPVKLKKIVFTNSRASFHLSLNHWPTLAAVSLIQFQTLLRYALILSQFATTMVTRATMKEMSSAQGLALNRAVKPCHAFVTVGII